MQSRIYIKHKSKKEHFALKSKPEVVYLAHRYESKKEHFAVKSKLRELSN